MEKIPVLSALVKPPVERNWEVTSATTLSKLLDLPEFKVTHFE